MNRSWVRFPQAAQIRPPGSGWAFLCALLVACGPTGVPGAAWLALMVRAAVCAGGRRPAREIATREPAARSGRSRGPPWPCHRPPAPRPGPASGDSPVPPGPSGALHTCGAWCADVWLCASARCPARPRSPSGAAAGPSGASAALRTGSDGGFALHEACWRRVAGVSNPRVVQFPQLVPPPAAGIASGSRASKRALSSVSHAIP